MTKKKHIGIIFFAALVVFIFWKGKSSQDDRQVIAPLPITKPIPEIKVIDPKRNLVERTPASTGYVNQPSANWEKKLETSLKEQAGNSLKDIKIKKEKSLVWMRDENPLMVESVIITLTNHKKSESTFRALVDSQTGKVLESWDRTIVDPGQIKEEGFKVKLDPRYTN
jgi:hypothetical protein